MHGLVPPSGNTSEGWCEVDLHGHMMSMRCP